MAAGVIAAGNITVERKITGKVTDWSRSSCNNAWYDTKCQDGQGWKSYAGFDSGIVLDVSAAMPKGENYEDLVSKVFDIERKTGQKPQIVAKYTQSLVDFIPINFIGKVNAYYASEIKIEP